jgi:hypothetical protein
LIGDETAFRVAQEAKFRSPPLSHVELSMILVRPDHSNREHFCFVIELQDKYEAVENK